MSETGTPGRYTRSFNGLVAATLVTVLAVLGFVGFRALNRTELMVEPEPVDYLAAAEAAQEAGYPVVYPEQLPDGWIATSVDLVRAESGGWGIGILTDDEDFVGLRLEDDSSEDLVEEYVDRTADEGDPARVESPLASDWETWSDDGGDLGYAAEVGEQTLLVYGSAGAEDLETLIGLLTDEPLRAPSAG